MSDFLHEDEVARFRDLVIQRLGIMFDDAKALKPQLRKRLVALAKAMADTDEQAS